MTGASNEKGPNVPHDGFVVPRPRRTDDIGRALCNAFSTTVPALPCDMQRWLAMLDRGH